jgi:exosortase
MAPADDPGFAHLVATAALGGAVFVAVAAALGAVSRREWAVVASVWDRVPRRTVQITLAATATLLLIVLYAPVVWGLVAVWATIPYYSYGFLIPLFSAWGLWEARSRLAPTAPGWSPVGAALLTAGLALRAAGTAVSSLTLAALSVPFVLGGAARLLLGRQGARAVAFPVAFLAFMAPLPDGAISTLSLPLQQLAAWFAGHSLAMLGVPTVRDGLQIYLPGVVLHVTEACNGLRFLLAMVVVGTAFAWTTQARVARRVAVLALAVIVGILANLLRVTGTGLFAYYWGPEAAAGFFHLAYGKVVYVVMLIPFVAGVVLLRRGRLRSAGNTL